MTKRNWFLAIGLALLLAGSGCRAVSETVDVAYNEFGPKALLAKYMWFKDASASLDKKVADIAVYESRIDALEQAYGTTPRAKWPRDDREQYNLWLSEEAGVKASYNQLAAEYNAQMSKINWQFANSGTLPAGAEKPLPREYKPYLNQ
jgi:hypothetical protein